MELVEQEQVAEVEDPGLGLGEIDVFGVPEGVRAAVVEEGALARALHGHDVGVAGGGFVGELEGGGGDAAVAEVRRDVKTGEAAADEDSGRGV